MSGMKILWLSHFVPYPPKGGCFQRSYNLIKEISLINDVYLVALKHKDSTHPDFDIDIAIKELEKICCKVHIIDISSSKSGASLYITALRSLFTNNPFSVNLFNSDKMHDYIKELTREIKFQLVHFDTISMAEYIKDIGDIPKVMNHHGVESFMVKRRITNESNILYKLYLFIEWYKLQRYETDYCNKFNLNLTVSNLDKEMLNKYSGAKDIEVIENGVDIRYFTPPLEYNNNNGIIFAGRLDQYSNRDGIIYFCTRVWPLLKSKYTDMQFTIIGNNPPPKLGEIAKNDDKINLLGYVEDVRPYFADAMISVCPIRDGGGTRIKILDALAMGMPIVTTSIGCEGIDVTPEKDIFIANTPEEFVEKIGKIRLDRDIRQKLRVNARITAEEKYSWSAIGDKLNRIYLRYM